VEADPPRDRSRSKIWWGVWVLVVVLWLVLSFMLDPNAEGAEQAGYVVGGWVAALAIAAALRGLYVLARRRSVAFLSPWLFVIAAVIGVLVKLPDIGETAERQEQASRIAARTPGEESEQVRECIEGGVDAYQEASADERALLTREAYEKLIGRACKEYERRGLFERGELDRAQLTAIVQEIFAEMRANGELPGS
jgi:hypothetical protein